MKNIEDSREAKDMQVLELEQINKMPIIIHDLLMENWKLKKELYTLNKEKISYHKNLDEIELYIKNVTKFKNDAQKYNTLKDKINKLIKVNFINQPLKKIKVYKELTKIYMKLKAE